MELWDAYDRNLNKIENIALIRGKQIPNGVYHIVCDIAVRHTDGTYLIMQRDYNKHFGGMWELTAGGSALQGETPDECAKRELSEETGIVSENIKQIGKVISDEHNTIYFEYLCITDCEKNSVTLQKGETVAYKWLTLEELKSIKPDELATTRIQNFINELKK